MSDWRIPLFDLDYGPQEEAAVQRVLQSRWLSMGEETIAFEKEFAEFLGVKHAIAVSNGTAALHLALLALEIHPGDEIIQPAINFVASANMTVAVGARPVFTDILALDEPTIDPKLITEGITPQTKAVVVMHYGGYPCRMAEIAEICQQRGIALIEDACHAVGARYLDPEKRIPHNKMAGAIGDVSCFSFYSNKNLSTGEGGMVVTNRDDLAERLRLLRSHGISVPTWDRHQGHAYSYDVRLHGYNYRIDEIHAALGRVQLEKLRENSNKRKQLVKTYFKQGEELLPGWQFPFQRYSGDSACHLFVAVAPRAEIRNRVVSHLKAEGIQSSLHYPCITDFVGFSEYNDSPVNQSREYTSRAITLPLFPAMTTEQVEMVCSTIAGVEF